MGIHQGDVKIRTAIQLAFEEIRKNPWILSDIFSDFLEDQYLADYGAKEIARATEWFLNNKIEVLNKYRLDAQSYPCITIAMGESPEDDREATLADLSVDVQELSPDEINRPIPYIVKPFTPASYLGGVLTASSALQDVSPGMLAVDPATGNAWEIIELVGDSGVRLKDSPVINADKLGVIPRYRVYRARRERASFRESYQIGCHVHGDPNQLLWLWSIVLYSILRYRESMLEARGMKISSVKSTDMVRDDAFEEGGENVYKRFIILTGLVEYSWLKSPKRIIEVTKIKDPDGVSTGVKIMSDTNVPVNAVDPERDDTWGTVKQTQSSVKKRAVMKG